MPLRYYLYISDSKVDMLLPQIAPRLAAKRTSEVDVDVKVVTVKRTIETQDEGRIARLERVVAHLEKRGDLGTVDEPAEYFTGRLPMRWGPFPGDGSSSLVFFGGETQRTLLGLGGSGRNLIGSLPNPNDGIGISSSSLPSILGSLDAASDADDEAVVEAAGAGRDARYQGDHAAFVTVHRGVRRLPGPSQTIEFIAKRLLRGPSPFPESDPSEDMSVLLGSPIYAALAD